MTKNFITLIRQPYLKEYKGSKMNKAGVIVGVVVCAGLVAPKIIGSIVENKYDDIASRFVDHPSIEITERSFTSHWFSGQSITKMKLKGYATEIDAMQIIVSEDFTFGPLIFANNNVSFALSHANIDLDLEISTADQIEQENIAAFIEQLNDKLLISSTMSYDLNYTTAIKMAATTFDEDGEQVDIGAIDSEFTVSDEKYIDGYLNWSGLEFKSTEAHVQMSSLAVTFNQEMINGDIYSANALALGDFSTVIKSIVAHDGNGDELLKVDNLAISGGSEIKEELMNVTLNYGAEHFSAADQELEQLNLAISVNKLDPKVLIELNELAMKMQQQPENTELLGQQIMSTATKLLVTNPEMSINDFSAITPEGKIKSDLKLVIDYNLYDKANPMSTLAALKGDAKGVAPMPFFQKLGLEALINIYIEQGYVLHNADEISFAAKYTQGQLTVNGKAIAL